MPKCIVKRKELVLHVHLEAQGAVKCFLYFSSVLKIPKYLIYISQQYQGASWLFLYFYKNVQEIMHNQTCGIGCMHYNVRNSISTHSISRMHHGAQCMLLLEHVIILLNCILVVCMVMKCDK